MIAGRALLGAVLLAALAPLGCSWDWDRFEPVPDGGSARDAAPIDARTADRSEIDAASCTPADAPEIPELLAPWNGWRTGSLHAGPGSRALRPEVRWSAVAGADGYRVVFGDPELPAAEVSVGAGVTRAVPDVDLPPGRNAWSVRACAAGCCSDIAAARFLWVGRTPHDVDGDGYGDVVAGAQREIFATGQEGAGVVWLGSATGPEATAALVRCDDDCGSPLMGVSAATADVNGDGFDDVLIGAELTFVTVSRAGAAWSALGSASGVE